MAHNLVRETVTIF